MSLSIEKTNKIIKYLKENKDVFEVLFFGIDCDYFKIEPKLYFKNYHTLIYQTHWLFENHCDNNKPVGILDNSIVFLEEDGIMIEYCKELQYLPYIFLTIRGVDINNINNMNDFKQMIFDWYHLDFNVVLQKYENWCLNNNIIIDFSSKIKFCEQESDKNPYHIDKNKLIFDISESAKDIKVKNLETLNESYFKN